MHSDCSLQDEIFDRGEGLILKHICAVPTQSEQENADADIQSAPIAHILMKEQTGENITILDVCSSTTNILVVVSVSNSLILARHLILVMIEGSFQ